MVVHPVSERERRKKLTWKPKPAPCDDTNPPGRYVGDTNIRPLVGRGIPFHRRTRNPGLDGWLRL